MNRLIAALALALFVAAPARAASTYAVTTDASSTTLKLNGRLHMQSLAGVEQLVVDSVRGLFTWTYGIQASTANFTGSGATTYSVTTSSGISVGGTGGVTASWFSSTTGFIGKLIGSISGGGAGQLLYQSAANTTAFLAAGANTQALVGGASAPAWSTLAGSTIAANISGLASRATQLGSAPTTCSGQAATGVDINGNATGCFSAGTGDVTQAGNNGFTGANTHSSAGSEAFSGPTPWTVGSSTGAPMLVTGSTVVAQGNTFTSLDIFADTSTLTANSLLTKGDILHIDFWCTSAASGGATRSCQLWINSTSVITTGNLGSGDQAHLSCTVFYLTSTTQDIECESQNKVTPIPNTQRTAGSFDATTTWVLKGSVNSNFGANDVTGRGLYHYVLKR